MGRILQVNPAVKFPESRRFQRLKMSQSGSFVPQSVQDELSGNQKTLHFGECVMRFGAGTTYLLFWSRLARALAIRHLTGGFEMNATPEQNANCQAINPEQNNAEVIRPAVAHPSTMESPVRGPWAAESACPPDVPIEDVVERLLDLRLHLQSCQTEDLGPHAEIYWTSTIEAIREVESACMSVQPQLDRCPRWVQVTVNRLRRDMERIGHFYQFSSCEHTGQWRPYPLHSDREQALDRIFYALAYLPPIEVWRPVEAAKHFDSLDQMEILIAKNVAKLFDDYRDDTEWLLWGTVVTLKSRCEELLERRRDRGEFWSWAPEDVRDIRLLADRLGCEEPILDFEAEDTKAAFSRGISDSTTMVWSPSTDSEVRGWLKRISSWCDQWLPAVKEATENKGIPGASTAVTDTPSETISTVVEAPDLMSSSLGTKSPLGPDEPVESACSDPHPSPTPNDDYWPPPPRRKLRVRKDVANQRAMDLAAKNPSFVRCGIRVWATQLGCSTGTVSKTEMWKLTRRKKLADKASQSVCAKTMDPNLLQEMVAGDNPELEQLIVEQTADIKKDNARARNVTRSR